MDDRDIDAGYNFNLFRELNDSSHHKFIKSACVSGMANKTFFDVGDSYPSPSDSSKIVFIDYLNDRVKIFVLDDSFEIYLASEIVTKESDVYLHYFKSEKDFLVQAFGDKISYTSTSVLFQGDILSWLARDESRKIICYDQIEKQFLIDLFNRNVGHFALISDTEIRNSFISGTYETREEANRELEKMKQDDIRLGYETTAKVVKLPYYFSKVTK